MERRYDERINLARALEQRLQDGDAAARDELAPLLEDEQPAIRLRAAIALSFADEVAAAPMLARIVSECLSNGRAAGQVGDGVARLYSLGEETFLEAVAREAETAALDAPESLRGLVAGRVLGVLSALGDARAVRLLRKLTASTNPANAAAAQRVLALAGDPESRKQLRAHLRSTGTPEVMNALRSLALIDSRPLLALAVDEIVLAAAETPPVKLDTLERFARAEAFRAVTARDAARFREGLEALVKLDRKPAVDIAREIARNLPTRGVTPALAAFLRRHPR